MASDDTPRRGESASGTVGSTEQKLQELLTGQYDLLHDRVRGVARADSLDKQRELLEELVAEAALLVELIEAIEEREE